MTESAFILTRHVRIPAAFSHQHAQLHATLAALKALDYRLNDKRLTLVYSAVDWQWPALEQKLLALMPLLKADWRFRLRSQWYAFVDANALQNAKSTTVHCCNKPPVMIKKPRTQNNQNSKTNE